MCELCHQAAEQLFEITIEQDYEYLVGYKVCDQCKEESK